MRRTVGIVMALVFAVYISALIYVLSFSFSKSIPQHADAVLILGAKVNLDNSPSEALYNRTKEAERLFKAGLVNHVLTTGGVGLGKEPESDSAQKLLKKDGVPIEVVDGENTSHNTFDSIVAIKKITDKKEIKSLIIVSDRYHVARGVMVARALGYNPVYWSYPNIGYYTKSQIAWSYAREAAAIIEYKFRLMFE